jgi:hypothetical protein
MGRNLPSFISRYRFTGVAQQTMRHIKKREEEMTSARTNL